MNKKHKILIPLMIAGVMNTVDTSSMNIAMPTFAEFFKLPLQTVSWISSIYLLVLASTLLTSGRIGDIFGFDKPFKAGVFIFSIGTILCSIAPTFPFLLAVRALQALGTSLIMAAIPALITTFFPPEERGKAMGLYVISVSLGLLTGPSLSGLILSKFSWRYIFLINVPLGITAIIASIWIVSEQTEKRSKRFDYAETVLTLIFLSSILCYLNRGPYIGWLSQKGLALVLTSIVSLAAFIFAEKKVPEPMLDLKLFTNKVFIGGLASNFLYFIAQMVMVFLAPVLLAAAKYPSNIIGFTVIAFPVTMLFFAPVGGNLSDRANPNIISALGAAIAGLSLLFIGTISLPSFSNTDLLWRMIIFGVGGGLFETSNSVVILSNAPEYMRGIASGTLAMVRYTGMVVGIALSSTLSSLRSEYYRQSMITASDQIIDTATIKGIKDVHLLAFILAIISSLIALIGAKYAHQKKTSSIEKNGVK